MRPQQLPLPLDRSFSQRSIQFRLTCPSSLGPTIKTPTKPKQQPPPTAPKSALQNEPLKKRLPAERRRKRLFRKLLPSVRNAKSNMVPHLRFPMSQITWISASVISRPNPTRLSSVWRVQTLQSKGGATAGFLVGRSWVLRLHHCTTLFCFVFCFHSTFIFISIHTRGLHTWRIDGIEER